MKKLLLLFVLFFGFTFGQKLEYAKKLNNIQSEEEMKSIAKDIVSGFKKPMKIYRVFNNPHKSISVSFYPEDVPEEVMKKDSEEYFCELCTEVIFEKKYKGANADLELEGTLFYAFHSIESSYLNLYPWWEKHFANGISKEDLLEKNSKDRYIIEPHEKVNIRFTKQTDVWLIRNVF